MPRLGSKKSRNGCQHCKARRVKCDEQRPCTNCTRYGVDCSLLTLRTQSFLSSHDASNTPPSQASSQTSPDNSSGATVPLLPAPFSLYAGSAPDIDGWMQDLELMHHYTAHAYSTMPGMDQAKQTWGFVVPQEAFRYKFLMHCILAFSASHLAYIDLQSRPRHRLLASSHQSAAIADLNRVLPDVTPSNCHAVFAASSLITVNAFAESASNSATALVEIFQLLRGMNIILSGSEALIHGGPFGAILRQIPDQPKPLPPLLSSFIVELQSLVVDIGSSSPVAYTAAQQLIDSLNYGIDNSTHPAMRAVMYWPIKLNQEYIDALPNAPDEQVRKVMQQYLRILDLAGSEFWFLSRWREVAF
ncbi:hypothetical protein BDV96DRAFT_652695 [Lophiotrema nucula]|uniref:Zn(2)-C6 fungal-type domain-containing protein n=1 Tax=Lophiotrema nucula TaxID=690887 RepID=A0A6A5YMY6_9PLEO|nr:hypothetical protein BDV96DRAFT_652695 [Lophiotrema nucula]